VCKAFLSVLAGMTSDKVVMPSALVRLLDVQTLLAFAIGLLAFIAPRQGTAGLYLGKDGAGPRHLRAVVLIVLLPLVIVQVMASDYSPFLYFQF
jgi:hypothetical protein